MNFIFLKILDSSFFYDNSINLFGLLIVLGFLAFVLIVDWVTRKGPLYFPDRDYGNLKNYTLGYSKTDPINFEAIENKTFGLGTKMLAWLLILIICIVPVSQLIWGLRDYPFWFDSYLF